MGEIDLIVIVLKGVGESECVIEPLKTAGFSLEVVLEVWDVLACSMPAETLFAVPAFSREAKDLHAVVVERIIFA